MWIALFFVVAFVVWLFVPRRDPLQPEPTFRKETRALETDPGWAAFIEEHCESPAETAFLRAMISAYDLRPVGGTLSGGGLRLDFQVEEGPFRVDFLANEWLVVEIDGAAWHSSPEAIERDRRRDEFFDELGYTVLRIPAKVVFQTPKKAVQLVRAALQKGKRIRSVPAQKSAWEKLSGSASAIGEGINAISESIAVRQAVELALADAKLAAHSEQSAITAAIKRAQSDLSINEWLSGVSEERRREFHETKASLAQAVADRRSARQQKDERTIEARVFPDAPPPHDNPTYNGAIQAAFLRLAEDRAQFLLVQTKIIEADPRLPPLVQARLSELDCGHLWVRLNAR